MKSESLSSASVQFLLLHEHLVQGNCSMSCKPAETLGCACVYQFHFHHTTVICVNFICKIFVFVTILFSSTLSACKNFSSLLIAICINYITLQMARRNAHRSPAHGRKFETGKRIPPTVSNHFRVSICTGSAHLF